MESRRHLFILNPAAGSARGELAREVHALFPEAEILHTRGPGDAEHLAAEQTLAPGDVVVACGGDGTFRETAQGVGARATLGHIPLGTACLVARELAIPRAPKAALRLLAEGKTRDVYPGAAVDDAGATHLFFLGVSAGPDADCVHTVSLAAKKRIGRYAYGLALARRMVAPVCTDIVCEVDGEMLRLSQAVALRMPWYGGPFRLGKQADLLAPGIELAGTPGGRLAVLRFFLAPMVGDWIGPGSTYRRHADRVLLRREAGDRFQIDGDPCRSTRLELTAQRNPLRVVCGR